MPCQLPSRCPAGHRKSVDGVPVNSAFDFAGPGIRSPSSSVDRYEPSRGDIQGTTHEQSSTSQKRSGRDCRGLYARRRHTSFGADRILLEVSTRYRIRRTRRELRSGEAAAAIFRLASRSHRAERRHRLGRRRASDDRVGASRWAFRRGPSSTLWRTRRNNLPGRSGGQGRRHQARALVSAAAIELVLDRRRDADASRRNATTLNIASGHGITSRNTGAATSRCRARRQAARPGRSPRSGTATCPDIYARQGSRGAAPGSRTQSCQSVG